MAFFEEKNTLFQDYFKHGQAPLAIHSKIFLNTGRKYANVVEGVSAGGFTLAHVFRLQTSDNRKLGKTIREQACIIDSYAVHEFSHAKSRQQSHLLVPGFNQQDLDWQVYRPSRVVSFRLMAGF